MNDFIIKEISDNLKINIESIKKTLELLKDNTIPFIARYRKNETGNLDEEAIKKIGEVYEYQLSLNKRKEDVIRLIDEKGLLTDEIKDKINECTKLVDVEDLYRPYKENKKTKATEAIKNGLEPLAKKVLSFPLNGNIDTLVKPYINDNVLTIENAIEGACYIIAEYISDNAYYRKWIRNYTYRNGFICSKKKKDSVDDSLVYEIYYDYKEAIKSIKPHRILAVNRAEDEKVVTVNIDVDELEIIKFLESKVIKNKDSFTVCYVIDAIKDSYKRLIKPSIEREIRSDLKDKAEDKAIYNFGKNLEALLLTPPMKEKVVLAFDPGFVNGCKLAVVSKTSKYLDSTVIKPFLKNISDSDISKCKLIVKNLIDKYNVSIIAIGNGTASRESEVFVSELIKEYNLNCKYAIVSEAGASIYSASTLAIEEFPNLEVEKRSAVSIARRLQDPLSELVKIPPSGIGVGLYQHDVTQSKLKENLDFVVYKAVNSVGVNINTTSPYLLKYVSGINKNSIDKIINYRNMHGRFNSRDEVKNVLSSKTYEQSIGFLRILDGVNVLDSTSIHPESYDIVLNLLSKLNLTVNDIGTSVLIDKLDNIDVNLYKDILNTDIYTLEDIIDSLKKPNRDPRDNMPQPILKSDILDLKDLKIGMKLQGTVRNVVDFGAFVDIGLHEDGLVHISQMTDKYIYHPSDILQVGDIIDCYVIDINMAKKKVSLSLIKTN